VVEAHRIQLEPYLSRIRYQGGRTPNAETLRALHLAHITTVPFENVEVQLGRPVLLDLPSLERKLVELRRGGYCFEQNGLFSAVLEQFGFRVTRLAARVRLGAHRILPRTHMLLLVECDGAEWIADVGFGGWGLLEPIPLVADSPVRHGAWTVVLRREQGLWVLQCPDCPQGPDLYAFTLEPQDSIDYEMANHYTSTHPNSRFVQTLTVQLPGAERRTILRGRELIHVHTGGSRSEVLHDDAQLFALLSERFGLDLSEADRTQLSARLPR
jgi:N-hydroxyarylamine O-acetyltransferase